MNFSRKCYKCWDKSVLLNLRGEGDFILVFIYTRGAAANDMRYYVYLHICLNGVGLESWKSLNHLDPSRCRRPPITLPKHTNNRALSQFAPSPFMPLRLFIIRIIIIYYYSVANASLLTNGLSFQRGAC